MNKLFNALSSTIIYLLVGQALAAVVLVGVVALKGGLTRDKLRQMIAVMQGVDLLVLREGVEDQRAKAQSEQISLADVAEARARKSRDLELREQELRNQLARAASMQRVVTDDTEKYQRMTADFEARLKMLREGTIAQSLDNARQLLENVKPKQAKEQIQKMLEGGEMKQAVALLAGMPIEKRAKIVTEFKNEKESDELAEMLRMIRAGEPEVTVIDEAAKQMKQGS
jgi:hypothetical protein